jgi:hypothetical protein
VRVDPPSGDAYYDVATREGGTWRYTPTFQEPGRYTLLLEAYDQAGNAAAEGPFEVSVGQMQHPVGGHSLLAHWLVPLRQRILLGAMVVVAATAWATAALWRRRRQKQVD